MSRTFFLVLLVIGLVAGGIGWFVVTQTDDAEELVFSVKPDTFQKDEIKALEVRFERAAEPGVLAQELLLDPAVAHLRNFREFRRLLRRNAPMGELSMVRDDEPGTRLEIRGRVLDENGSPVPGALVYAYQADAKGEFHPLMADAEPVARLFGYLRTDGRGAFRLRTVRPANYSFSPSTPARITLRVRKTGFESVERFYRPNIYFDDDPALGEEERATIAGEKGVIAALRPDGDGGFFTEWSHVIRIRPDDEEGDGDGEKAASPEGGNR